MKIVAVSDTHGLDIFPFIPKCDILLIAGDISPNKLSHDHSTQRGWFETNFIEHLKMLRNKVDNIVFIAGNHDTYLYNMYASKCNDDIKKLLPNNVYYLCDESVTINGIKIYGIPWCSLPSWGRKGPPVWNFADYDSVLIEKVFSKIPSDSNIILAHGPAYGFSDVILDEGVNRQNLISYNTFPDNLGSKAFIEQIKKISESEHKIQYVLTGHIHSADRIFREYNSIKFACVSLLDECYLPGANNKPLIINYDESKQT